MKHPGAAQLLAGAAPLLAAPLLAAALVAAGCAAPARNLGAAPAGAGRCALLARWAAEKQADLPQRSGESSAEDDAAEAIACYRREKDDRSARGTLLSSLIAQAKARQLGPLTARTGGFEDGLARKLAALALSAHAAGEVDTFSRAQGVLQG